MQIITAQDWDSLVFETYGKPYNFQQQDGCKPRGLYKVYAPEDYEEDEIPVEINGEVMGASFKSWLDRSPEEKFFKEDFYNTLFWNRNFYPDLGTLVEDLRNKGLCPKEDFRIEVDW